MPRGIYERAKDDEKPEEVALAAPEEAPQPEDQDKGDKGWIEMTLTRAYRPTDDKYKTVLPDGTLKKAEKDPNIVTPGTEGFFHKLPVGTKISVPIEEAQRIKKLGLGYKEDGL